MEHLLILTNSEMSAEGFHVLDFPLMLAEERIFWRTKRLSRINQSKQDQECPATSQYPSSRVQGTQRIFKAKRDVFQKLRNFKFSAELCESCESVLSVWRECATGKMANSNKRKYECMVPRKESRNTHLNSAETKRLYRVALSLFSYVVMWLRTTEKLNIFFAIHSYTLWRASRVCSAINNRREANKRARSIDTWISFFFYYISACHTHKRLFKETRLDSMGELREWDEIWKNYLAQFYI